MFKTMTNCRHASRLISEQLDHPLPVSKRIMLKIHLMMCTNCVFFGRQIKALKNIIGRHAENEEPSPEAPSLSNEVQERIKLLMREQDN